MSANTLRATIDIARRGLPLLAIAFLADAAFTFIFLIALQSYLPESLHASAALAGYALAAFGVAKLCSQVLSGVVSDRLGTRRTIIGGTALLLAADAAMLPLAHVAPAAIIAAAAVVGLGSSVLWPAVYSAGAARYGDNEKSRFTALLTLATVAALGVALGGGALLDIVAPFTVAMLFPIAFAAAALAIALVTPVSASEAPPVEPEARPSLRELPRVLRSPQRVAFSAIVLSESMALGALTAIFRAYGRDILGVSLMREGLMLAPAAALGAACVMAGGTLADRMGTRPVMAPGFALAAAAVLLLAFVTQPGFVVVVAAAGGIGFGLALPTIASTMMQLAGGHGTRGGIIGWFMSMDGLGHSIGPAAAALLLAMAGAEAAMVLAGAGFMGVALIAATQTLRTDVTEGATGAARAVTASAPAAMRAEVGQ